MGRSGGGSARLSGSVARAKTVERGMKHRTGWTGAAILMGSVIAATLGHNACVPESEHQASTWSTRDVLGLSPSWVSGLDAVDRGEVRARLDALLLEQAEDGAWASGPSAPGPAGSSLVSVDGSLEVEGREPLLVAWIVGEGQQEVGRSCHLAGGDLTGEVSAWQEAGPVWVIDAAFEDNVVDGVSEREALERRLPRLGSWLSRCSDDAGYDPIGRPLVEVVRADGAPTLMAFWPDRDVVYVNPLVLALWEADTSVEAAGLRSTRRALEVDELNTCTVELARTCEVCNTPDKVQQASLSGAGTCSRVLFSQGEIWDQCNKLDFEIPSGFLRWCLNDVVARYNVQVDFRTCLGARTDANGRDLYSACDPVFSGTPEELAQHYSGFVVSASASTCANQFVECVPKPNNMQPTDPGNGGGGSSCDEACSDSGGDGCDGEHAYGCDDLCDEDAGTNG